MSVGSNINRAVNWVANYPGSTRPIALVRIGLTSCAWAEFGWDFCYMNWHSRHSWALFLGTLFFLSSIPLFFGIASRTSAFVLGVTLLITLKVLGLDAYDGYAFVHRHTYLLSVAILLLSLTPCGRSLSVERWFHLWRARRNGTEPPAEWGNLWAVRLIAFQSTMVYLWGAIEKTTIAFMSGARLQQVTMSLYTGSDWPFRNNHWIAAGFCILAIATVILEYALAIGLWIPRFQPWLIFIGILFHAFIFITMPVATFTCIICILYLCYLDPAVVDAALTRFAGTPAQPPVASTDSWRHAARRARG
jgi:hypothetical protein